MGNDLDAINLALVVLRVALGLTIMAHGYNHAWGGGKLAGTAGWFESMGLRPGRVHALAATVTELAAGAALVLGLFTPLACAGVVGVMVVAWVTAHRTNGFFIFAPGQGWEYVAMLTVVGVVLATLGPGEWSADDVLGIDANGWTGMLIALVLGAGGAGLLLALAWRPDPPEADDD